MSTENGKLHAEQPCKLSEAHWHSYGPLKNGDNRLRVNYYEYANADDKFSFLLYDKSNTTFTLNAFRKLRVRI